MSSIDQQFVEYIVKSLVSHPDDVKIDRRIDEKGVLLELTVNAEDLGRVIGKRGATAQSLRTLLRALGTKNEARYNLKIVDNGPPQSAAEPKPEYRQETTATPETASEPPEVASKEADPEPEDSTASTDDSSDDILSKTRKELEELDDLDV